MAASEKTALGISGNKSNKHEFGDQGIPNDCFSNGQGLNMGIINQYGQLMGEFSRLDDELWFSKPDDDDAVMIESNGGFQWDLLSANVDLQKLSIFVDNTVSNGGSAVAKGSSSSLKGSFLDQSQTSSPCSILPSRKPNSSVRTSVIKRARSKRHHPSKCNSHFKKQNNSSQNYMDCPLLDEIAEPVVRMKKVNDLLQSGPAKGNQNSDPEPIPKQKLAKNAVKKCSHCESTRTPQWREGPLGRATLCNACGVQFRNGRLFPEYRPLSSPHFDPSLHSNVPKKVHQMRMSKNY